MFKILNSKRTITDGLSENSTINDLVYYKYAPVNSVDVEKSFSMFKLTIFLVRQLK